MAADLVALAAYALVLRVMRKNRFLSRVVEVEPGQEVISTGPYVAVHQSFYAAIIPLYVFTPLALGSFWALFPAAFIHVVIVANIVNEEQVMSRGLATYRKYARQVKYRLIPGIW